MVEYSVCHLQCLLSHHNIISKLGFRVVYNSHNTLVYWNGIWHQTDSSFHIPIPHTTSCLVKEVCPQVAHSLWILTLFLMLSLVLVFTM